MIIANDRTPLSTALQDPNLTILVIADGGDGTGRDIHDLLENRNDMEPWRRWFLVGQLAVLTAAERTNWFGDRTGRYVVLGGNVPKSVGSKGPLSKLLLKSGGPSILRIRQAFAKGDQL